MIVITSKGIIKKEEPDVLIMVGNRVVGSIPRNAVVGQLVTIKNGSTATMSVYDGKQWQQI